MALFSCLLAGSISFAWALVRWPRSSRTGSWTSSCSLSPPPSPAPATRRHELILEKGFYVSECLWPNFARLRKKVESSCRSNAGVLGMQRCPINVELRKGVRGLAAPVLCTRCIHIYIYMYLHTYGRAFVGTFCCGSYSGESGSVP